MVKMLWKLVFMVMLLVMLAMVVEVWVVRIGSKSVGDIYLGLSWVGMLSE